MKIRAILYIILAGILWGTSGIFVHYLAPLGFSSVQMTATRGTVSFIALAVFALIKDRGAFKVDLRTLGHLAAIGASLFGTATLYYVSMQMTSVSTAVVLMYTAPIYVTVFSVAYLGERMSRGKMISVALMLVGCCLVSGVVGGLKFNVVGIILGILTGIVYAAYNILTKIAVKRGTGTVSVTVYSFLFMGAFAWMFSEPDNYFERVSKSPATALPLLVALGITTCVLPYLFYTLSMKYLSAGTATALGIVEPMSATLFGVILLGEDMDVFKIAGIALILLSVVLLSRSEGESASECDKELSFKGKNK